MTQNLGHIVNLQTKLAEPLPLEIDMAMRDINLVIGHNASGKSLILKLNWVLGSIMAVIVETSLSPSQIEELVQFTFDKSFENQNFDGSIKAKFEGGDIGLVMRKGKLESVAYFVDSKVKEATVPVFMSTTLRTFAQMNQFLKTESLVKDEEELLGFYRLYDVAFMERFKLRHSGETKISEDLKNSLKEDFKLDIDLNTIFIQDRSVVYATSIGEVRQLSALSNGEQSIINMLLANS